MNAINAATRKALARLLALHGPDIQSAWLGLIPGVTSGLYDRVNGKWVLRSDGGSVALQHRAESFGALGTPDRNHDCPDCRGLGEVSIYPCQRCLGAGELTADGVPELRPAMRKDWREFAAVRVLSDAVLRTKVSKARAAGKLGRQQ